MVTRGELLIGGIVVALTVGGLHGKASSPPLPPSPAPDTAGLGRGGSTAEETANLTPDPSLRPAVAWGEGSTATAGVAWADGGRQWNCNVWKDRNGEVCASGWATEWDDVCTASGVPADLEGLIACSLPTGRCEATRGSPFRAMPWGTVVKVYCVATHQVIYAPLIDEGPAWVAEAGTGKPGSAMIDLTPAAVRALKMTDNAIVCIRIMQSHGYEADILHGVRAMWIGAE